MKVETMQFGRHITVTTLAAYLGTVSFAHSLLADGLNVPAPSRVHIELYNQVRGAITGIRGPQRTGTGVVISPNGLILSSSHVTGEQGVVRVHLPGYRLVEGKVIFTKKELELALVQIEPKEKLPFLVIGDSDATKIGERAYVIGNVQNSIINDDIPALSVGVVSGRFMLEEKRDGHLYTGPVLETTAAINRGLNGAPLLNKHGKIIGLVTLNYSTKNWSGLVIPINELKKDLQKSGYWGKQ